MRDEGSDTNKYIRNYVIYNRCLIIKWRRSYLWLCVQSLGMSVGIQNILIGVKLLLIAALILPLTIEVMARTAKIIQKKRKLNLGQYR